MRDDFGHSPLLPPGELSEFVPAITPVENGGSFLLDELLRRAVDDDVPDPPELSPPRLLRNAAYCKHMSMPKLLGGQASAEDLAATYHDLKGESQPAYLEVAGWAAMEAALTCDSLSVPARRSALESARQTWERAVIIQAKGETRGTSSRFGEMHRLALNLAVMPLLSGIALGEVTQTACRTAFENCLTVAESSIEFMHAAHARRDLKAVHGYSGVQRESSELLAYNLRLSPARFMILAMARCDNGLFNPDDTHDLLEMRLKAGRLVSAAPIEIKGKPSAQDLRRYRALLVPGETRPEPVIKAIAATYRGRATGGQITAAKAAAERVTNLIGAYRAGKVLGDAALTSITRFHDNVQAIARHPSLAALARAA